jgi:nucleoside 2-deoxyribosyltransferase
MKRHYYYTNQTVHRHRAREIELKIEKETGLRLENPFYDGEHKEIEDLDAGRPIKVTADEIVGADLRKIRDSDGIVALLSSFKNIGSAMEIAICSYSWGKPVYVIATNDKLYDHPWVAYFATRRFHSAKEFIQWYHKEGYAIG